MKSADSHTCWRGKLQVDRGLVLDDITFEEHEGTAIRSQLRCEALSFLSFVDPDLIPLHLIQGHSFAVSTGTGEARSWLREALIEERVLKQLYAEADEEFVPWHATALLQSRVAALFRPGVPQVSDEGEPRITEVLVYADRESAFPHRLPTPPNSSDLEDYSNGGLPDSSGGLSEIRFRCLYLSTDLLYKSLISQKQPLLEGEARFAETTNSSKKRLSDLFDEASDQRKKIKRHSGQSISVAASKAVNTEHSPSAESFDSTRVKIEPEDSVPEAKTSAAESGVNLVQPGRRAPQRPATPAGESVSRPQSRRGTLERQRSSLSRVITTDQIEDSSIENKNKQTVSRIVMAGMRLYGLQQRKPRAQTPSSAIEQQYPVPPTPGDDAEARQDLEYKAVYHQTYKATLFTHRHWVNAQALKPEIVQDTVDKLLAIFCSEPT